MTDLRLSVIEEEPKTPDSPRTPEPADSPHTGPAVRPSPDPGAGPGTGPGTGPPVHPPVHPPVRSTAEMMECLSAPPGGALDEVRALLKEYYSVLAVDVWPLPSLSAEEVILKVRGNREGVIQEFTLKVTASTDQEKDVRNEKMSFVDCQMSVMRHLRQHGVQCPATVPTKSGETSTCISTSDGEKEIQLFTYMKGTPLSAVSINEMVLFDIGVLLASLRKSFTTFQHPFIEKETPTEIWKKENFRNLLSHVGLIGDESLKQITEHVILAFCHDFEDKLNLLETGYNHGDLHPANIIQTKSDHSLTISERYAVIDFALLNYSFNILDLSVALASFMMAAETRVNFVEAGGHLLAGYRSVQPLYPAEKELLYICVCVLYCKVLLTTAPLHEVLAGDQSYVGKVARRVGPQLTELWRTPQRVVTDIWDNVCAKYGLPVS